MSISSNCSALGIVDNVKKVIESIMYQILRTHWSLKNCSALEMVDDVKEVINTAY